jgi:hypothetical protein
MVSVLNGAIADGYNGMLGWFWVACTAFTIVLIVLTRMALKRAPIFGGHGRYWFVVPGYSHRFRHGPRSPCHLGLRLYWMRSTLV